MAPSQVSRRQSHGDGSSNAGLVGQLQRRGSDIGWADVFMVPDRMKYIDYTEPYRIEHASFMLSQ